MHRPSSTSSPQLIALVTTPSSKPQQNCLLTWPVCLPAQSAGQVAQFSPSPASQSPLPHRAPLSCAQSAGQLMQSSSTLQNPSTTHQAGSFTVWNCRIIS
jgi:hypothetical protein